MYVHHTIIIYIVFNVDLTHTQGKVSKGDTAFSHLMSGIL